MGAAESRPDAEKESQVDSPPQAETPSPAPIPNLHPEQSLPNNLPKPVDLNASRDDLIDAVDARDEYILYLTTKLRTLQGQVIPVINWEVVNNCPDDLKKGVQGIAAQLEQQLKEAELSISLERANLGRERAKLMKVKEFLETQVMKLGGQHGAAGNEPPQDKGGKAAGDKSKADMERRWNRLFSREK